MLVDLLCLLLKMFLKAHNRKTNVIFLVSNKLLISYVERQSFSRFKTGTDPCFFFFLLEEIKSSESILDSFTLYRKVIFTVVQDLF